MQLGLGSPNIGIYGDGTLVGWCKNVNFIEGGNVTFDISFNTNTYAMDVTVNSTGGSGGSIFTQSSPSDHWVVSHNLGYKPDVSILNSGGSEVQAEILHASVNLFHIYFTAAIAGEARMT